MNERIRAVAKRELRIFFRLTFYKLNQDLSRQIQIPTLMGLDRSYQKLLSKLSLSQTCPSRPPARTKHAFGRPSPARSLTQTTKTTSSLWSKCLACIWTLRCSSVKHLNWLATPHILWLCIISLVSLRLVSLVCWAN